MLITVSGPIGSGKSTTAAGLAERFDLEHISGGDIFRELAAEREMTPLEFNRLAEEDESIDLDLDRRLRRYAVERDDLVLESRLSGWLAADHADVRVGLIAPLSVRARRVADREGIDPDRARADTEARAESEAKRYREYYGIDVTDLSVYDLTVNTARWDSDAVVDVVAGAVEAHAPAGDEGGMPVDVEFDFDRVDA